MKKISRILCSSALSLMAFSAYAQGWPANYGGVMLQAFSWDSYSDTQWYKLERQADELATFFDLVWIPQSGRAAATTSMGYDPLYWYNQTSSFGNETELKSFINAMKERGSGVIADVVINHRGNLSNWVDFPSEVNPYDGQTYSMSSTDICHNDDGGATLTWASKNGYSLSANGDTGEDWGGMRDLDHKSENVQKNVKAYLKYLLNYLGYTGFRYDMVKGYSGSYTGMYNTDCGVQYSVGECWDGTNTIKNWIEATKVNGMPQSAAFDFQFRYTVRNAANNANWSNLNKQNDGNWPLVSNNYQSGDYRRYAVTFVENHDTQYRSASDPLDPIKKDTLAANAYLLAMPGTPCVFQPHWLAYKQEIKAMIDARRTAGITNESSYAVMRNAQTYFAGMVKSNNNNVLCVVVGPDLTTYVPQTSLFVEALSGYHYKYYLARSLETAWADVSSGEFTDPFNVKLVSVSQTDDVQLVYTLDGSTPTASSTKVDNGTSLNISNDCVLKAGLLVNGVVKGVISRNYTFKKQSSQTGEIPSCAVYVEGKPFAYFEKPADWGARVNVWAWMTGGDGRDYVGTGWPGVSATNVGTTDNGNEVWQWISSQETNPDNIIFNDGGNQTADLAFVNGGYYTSAGLKATISQSGIAPVVANQIPLTSMTVYNIQGQLVRTLPAGTSVVKALDGLPRGIYVVDGKKIAR